MENISIVNGYKTTYLERMPLNEIQVTENAKVTKWITCWCVYMVRVSISRKGISNKA